VGRKSLAQISFQYSPMDKKYFLTDRGLVPHSLSGSRSPATMRVSLSQSTTPGMDTSWSARCTANDSGQPVSVSAYRRLAVSADSILDIAWADSTHVAVLGSRDGVVHAEVATVGGGTRLIGQPQNPKRISGGNKGVARARRHF